MSVDSLDVLLPVARPDLLPAPIGASDACPGAVDLVPHFPEHDRNRVGKARVNPALCGIRDRSPIAPVPIDPDDELVTDLAVEIRHEGSGLLRRSVDVDRPHPRSTGRCNEVCEVAWSAHPLERARPTLLTCRPVVVVAPTPTRHPDHRRAQRRRELAEQRVGQQVGPEPRRDVRAEEASIEPVDGVRQVDLESPVPVVDSGHARRRSAARRCGDHEESGERDAGGRGPMAQSPTPSPFDRR